MNQKGFTLLELMVVLIIIGVAFSTVRLATRSSDDQQLLYQNAQRLQQMLHQARWQAQLGGKDLGLFFHEDGAKWLNWEVLTDPDSGEVIYDYALDRPYIVWNEVDENQIGGFSFEKESFALALTLDGEAVTDVESTLPPQEERMDDWQPHILFHPSGETNVAFEFIWLLDSEEKYKVMSDGFNESWIEELASE